MQKNELRHINNIDDVFKNRNLTFEDIEKLSYKQFNQRGGGLKADVFRPSDIIDLDDDSDDEILRKFKEPSKASPKRFSPTNKKYRKIGYNANEGQSQKVFTSNARNYGGISQSSSLANGPRYDNASHAYGIRDSIQSNDYPSGNKRQINQNKNNYGQSPQRNRRINESSSPSNNNFDINSRSSAQQ